MDNDTDTTPSLETRDVLATLQKLPPLCYAALPSTGETIAIKRGESGYHPVASRLTADELNSGLNPPPSPAQVEAMLTGSMFGWEAPGADPDVLEQRRRDRP